MKRKIEDSGTIHNKKIRPNSSKEILLALLKSKGKALTLADLKHAFSDLSKARIYELLGTINSNHDLMISGVSNLVTILLMQAFKCSREATDPCVKDLCTLLQAFKNSNILKKMPANVYNTWLLNLKLEAPPALNYLPDILMCLNNLIPDHIDFYEEIDHIDLGIISKALLPFVTLPKTKQQEEKNRWIFATLHTLFFTKNVRLRGQLDPTPLKKLFDSHSHNNHLSLVTYHYGSMMYHPHLLKKNISPQTLVHAFTILLKINSSLTISTLKKFSKLYKTLPSPKFHKKKSNSAQDMQEFFNAVMEKNTTPIELLSILQHLAEFVYNHFNNGKIDGLHDMLHKILLRIEDTGNVCSPLQTIAFLANFLKEPLKAPEIEKLIPWKYNREEKSASLSVSEADHLLKFFFTIRSLQSHSSLSGNFTDHSLDIIYFVANSNIRNLNIALVAGTLSFFGIYLLHADAESQTVNTLTTRLFNHLFGFKYSYQDIDSLFLSIQNIVASKKFTGVFNTVLLHNFLDKIMFDENFLPYKIIDYIEILSFAARNKHIQNFSVLKLYAFLKQRISKDNPRHIFITTVLIANLIESGALDSDRSILEQLLKEHLIYLSSKNLNYFASKWGKHILNIEHILKLPDSLRTEALYTFFPLMISMIQDAPHPQTIITVLHALKEFSQSNIRYQYLPIATPEELTILMEHFYKMNRFAPEALLRAYVIAADLLGGKMDIYPLVKTLREHILSAKLLNKHAHVVTIEETRHYQIPIITVILEFINIHEPTAVIIADLFDAMRILIEQKQQAETESLIIAREKSAIMQHVLELIINMPSLQKEHLISILNGFFCLLKHNFVLNFEAEQLVICFIKLGRLDIRALHNICSELSPSLITNEQYAFDATQDWIEDAFNATPEQLTDLCNKIPSVLLMHAVSTTDMDYIELFLPTVVEGPDAIDTITTACETAISLLRYDIVSLLLKSRVLTDNHVQLILEKTLQSLDLENNPEHSILILYTLITWQGIQADFVRAALEFMESLINKYHVASIASLMPRLNNVINYSRIIEKHGLFYTPDRHSEYYGIDYGDARDIMSFRNIR